MQLWVEVAEDERWLGGTVYIENLIATLSMLPEAERPSIWLDVPAGYTSPLVQRLRLYPVIKNSERSPELPTRGFWGRFCQKLSRRLSCEVTQTTEPTKTIPCDLFFPVFEVQQVSRPNLFWIPDFQHFYYPHLFSEQELDARNERFSKIAQQDALLLLSSRTAVNDFHQHFPNAKVQTRIWSFCSYVPLDEPVEVVASTQHKYALPDRYCYIPNQFWIHKDHMTAFRAISRLHERGMDIPIVCTGYQSDYRDEDHFPRVLQFIQESGLDHQVHLLGVIPRREQLHIFRQASIILQPSLFEGWSTVIEDAKAIGRPVIASDIPVHKEQLKGENKVWFFPAGDETGLAKTLEEVWPSTVVGPDEESETRAALRAAGRRLIAGRAFMKIALEACFLYRSQLLDLLPAAKHSCTQ
jgi:glycosyltransferase involved in cell wall biosynthesis